MENILSFLIFKDLLIVKEIYGPVFRFISTTWSDLRPASVAYASV